MPAVAAPASFIDSSTMNGDQTTIPKDVQNALGIGPGSRITFVVENGEVRLVNSMVYALEKIQQEMANEKLDEDMSSDDAIVAYVKKIRAEGV